MILFFWYIYSLVSLMNRFTRGGVAELNASQTTQFLDHVFKTYDKKVAPVSDVLNVSVQMYIEDMVPLETINSHYSIDMYFRTYWTDPRLAYGEYFTEYSNNTENTLAFSNYFVSSIWLPDIFFPNMKVGELHKVTQKNRLIRLKSNGWIFFSQRITLTVYCPMNLRYFPFDEQSCNFTMLSFAYNNEDISLSWNLMDNGPIFPPIDTNMEEFTFLSFTYGKMVNFYGVAGAIETLFVRFMFTRNRAYYMIQMYLPCQLIVILSWVGFWIDYRSTPARVALGITTVLTMATLSNNIRATVPPTSYTKSIDIYLLVSFFYVFSALIEYAIVGITEIKMRKITHKRSLRMNGTTVTISRSLSTDQTVPTTLPKLPLSSSTSSSQSSQSQWAALSRAAHCDSDDGDGDGEETNGDYDEEANDFSNSIKRLKRNPIQLWKSSMAKYLSNGSRAAHCDSDVDDDDNEDGEEASGDDDQEANDVSNSIKRLKRNPMQLWKSSIAKYLSNGNSNTDGIKNPTYCYSDEDDDSDDGDDDVECGSVSLSIPDHKTNGNCNKDGIINPTYCYDDDGDDAGSDVECGVSNSVSINRNHFKKIRKRLKKNPKKSFKKQKQKMTKRILEHNLKNLESHFIDKQSRIIFPASFILLNIIYFVFHHVQTKYMSE